MQLKTDLRRAEQRVEDLQLEVGAGLEWDNELQLEVGAGVGWDNELT